MSIRDLQVSVPASLFGALWSDFVEFREARIDQWGDAGDLFGRVWCVLGSSADVLELMVMLLRWLLLVATRTRQSGAWRCLICLVWNGVSHDWRGRSSGSSLVACVSL
jgi:hypothetical protein